MIVNFITNYQFIKRLDKKWEQIYTVEKTKLLGTILTNDLKLDEKLSELIKKANARMCLLRKVASFRFETHIHTMHMKNTRTIMCCLAW